MKNLALFYLVLQPWPDFAYKTTCVAQRSFSHRVLAAFNCCRNGIRWQPTVRSAIRGPLWFQFTANKNRTDVAEEVSFDSTCASFESPKHPKQCEAGQAMKRKVLMIPIGPSCQSLATGSWTRASVWFSSQMLKVLVVNVSCCPTCAEIEIQWNIRQSMLDKVRKANLHECRLKRTGFSCVCVRLCLQPMFQEWGKIWQDASP